MTSRICASILLALLLGCQQQHAKTDPDFEPAQVFTATDGRQYRVQQLDKKPGGYAWINDTLLRYFPNGFYEVERQDDRPLLRTAVPARRCRAD